MTGFSDVYTRFGNLLDQYDLPQDAFSLETEDSESWLFVRKADYLGDSDYAIWMQLVDAYGADVPDDLPFEAFAVEDLPQAPAETATESSTESDPLPETTVSTASLSTAHRMLTEMQDAQIEDEGEASDWILAARRAVQMQLEARDE
jgi:hypothetical protein